MLLPCIILLLIPQINGKVNIAYIYEDQTDEDAFNYAINRINSLYPDPLFEPIVSKIDLKPFDAMNAACSIFSAGALGIFGPADSDNIDAIQSICDVKEVPHFLNKWKFTPLRSGTVINLHPHPDFLNKAYLDILIGLEWKTFTVLYEDNNSLLGLGGLIQSANEKGLSVTVKQLDKRLTGSYRPTFKDVRTSGQRNIVMNCKQENLEEVLILAQQMGMMNSHYNYFITNLDLHTVDLTPFQYCQTNITGIRLVHSNNEKLVDVATNLFEDEETAVALNKVTTDKALIIDGISLFHDALKETGVQDSFESHCNVSNAWPFGQSIVNMIKTSSYSGLTGLMKFDHEGFRSLFDLELYELQENGITVIGSWNSSEGLNLTRDYPKDLMDDPETLRNKTFVVITTLTDPYGMLKESSEHLTGNARFEGFGIDLIHELSLMEGFNYTFIIREDKANGVKNPVTQKWSGMLGDLMDYRADLAITDLTITKERQEVVDFTSPFMNLGISILFKKPKKAPPSFFSFAEPFALETWMGLAVAYSVVSISLFLMGRLCPDEWTNPFPCIEEPEFLVNQFSFQNSIWFTIGSLMQQGTEIAPIAISTRMVAGMWWFFVLIMVSSYTANLAAFLTNEVAIELFTDVVSLVQNAEKYKISYGAKANGSTAKFFTDSDDPIYQKIGQFMVDHPEAMMTDNRIAVEKAEKENYAFFMESTSIEYETQRHCDLMMYGKLLDDKGYGIAMRKNSPYRKRLSTAVLKLQSSGRVADLKRKWWEERRGGGACGAVDVEAAAATALGLQNVEGVFYVTIYGAVTAGCVVLMEMVVYTIKLKRRTKMTLKEAFKCEMKAYLNFDSNVKPVNQSKSESKSKSGSPKESKEELGKSNVEEAEPAPYGFVVSSVKQPITKTSIRSSDRSS